MVCQAENQKIIGFFAKLKKCNWIVFSGVVALVDVIFCDINKHCCINPESVGKMWMSRGSALCSGIYKKHRHTR